MNLVPSKVVALLIGSSALFACASDEPDVRPSLSQPRSEWIEPSTPGQQAVLVARYGPAWSPDFDPVLETPRSLRPGLLVTDPVAFVREHADLFGTDEVVLDGTIQNQDLQLIALAQRYRGLRVVSGHLGLSISHGRLVLVQGSTYRIGGLDTAARIDEASALATVEASLAMPARSAGDQQTSELVVLPMRSPGAVDYRLAWEVTATRGLNRVISYIDAHDGRFLIAYDGNVYDYPGSISLTVDQRTVGDPIVTVPGAYNRVTTSLGTMTSAADGTFVFAGNSGPLTVTSQLRGTYVTVQNAAGPNASFSGAMQPDVPFALAWTDANSTIDQRDTFHAVNTTNRFVSTIFSLPWMGTALTANVNLAQTCNAYWNGSSINFFRAGGGCNNTGRIFDVVAHEWGHGLDQNAPGGAQDGGLGEFIGDLVSFTQTDSPLLGPGFFTAGGAVRDLEDPNYECYDPSKTEVHDAGQLLGAVVWDIHEDLEAAGVTGEQLKRIMLLPIAGAQTRSQWYNQMLVVDDDDGDLSNGTPHQCLIYNQFKAHSCGSTRWPGIPASDPAQCSGPPPALQAHWKFDETSGAIAHDSSPFARDGSLSGRAWWSTGDKAPLTVNTAALNVVPSAANVTVNLFDGLDFTSASSFTIALWAKLETAIAPGTSAQLITKGPCSNVNWQISHDDASNLVFRSGAATSNFGASLAVGSWAHVAITRSGGTNTMYVDGVPTATSSATIAAATGSGISFGSNGCSPTSPLRLDDARIYNYALTAAEIAALGRRPAAPTNVVGTVVSSTRIQLAWDAVPGATKYFIYKGSAPGNAVLYTSTTTASYINGHIAPGETTYWRVAVAKDGLNSLPSPEVVLTTPGPLSPPADVTATAISSTRISLTWSPVTGATKYYVYQSINGGPFAYKTTKLASTGTQTISIANLTPSTTYGYQIQAVTPMGNSGMSATATATTPP